MMIMRVNYGVSPRKNHDNAVQWHVEIKKPLVRQSVPPKSVGLHSFSTLHSSIGFTVSLAPGCCQVYRPTMPPIVAYVTGLVHGKIDRKHNLHTDLVDLQPFWEHSLSNQCAVLSGLAGAWSMDDSNQFLLAHFLVKRLVLGHSHDDNSNKKCRMASFLRIGSLWSQALHE